MPRKAVLFAPGIVSGRHTFHSSIAATPDGTEMFWSVGGGRNIVIYRMRKVEGKWTAPEMFSKGDAPFISPDGSYLLANIEDEGDRLVILFKKKDGDWTAAIELADIVGINHGFCPMVTPDGRYLFFVSLLDGIYAPYWMDASFIKELRRKSLRGNSGWAAQPGSRS